MCYKSLRLYISKYHKSTLCLIEVYSLKQFLIVIIQPSFCLSYHASTLLAILPPLLLQTLLCCTFPIGVANTRRQVSRGDAYSVTSLFLCLCLEWVL